MDTEEIVIENDIMDMAQKYSARTGRSVDEILDRYIWFQTEGHKEYGDAPPEILEVRRMMSIYGDDDESDDW